MPNNTLMLCLIPNISNSEGIEKALESNFIIYRAIKKGDTRIIVNREADKLQEMECTKYGTTTLHRETP